MPQFDETLRIKKVEELRLREAEDLAKVLSQKYQVLYADLSRTSINTDALRLIDEDQARKAGVAAFQLSGHTLSLATLSPKGDQIPVILDDLRRKHYEPTIYMVSPTSLARAWERYKEVSDAANTKAGLIEISSEHLQFFLSRINSIGDLEKNIHEVLTSEKEQGQGVSKILEIILAGAIAVGASDIHIEPQEALVRLRFRLDGVLHDMSEFAREPYALILSRVKLISGLKLNVKQTAQDGRFTINLDAKEFEIRTSVLPGGFGESLVLRILDPESIEISLETMGMEAKLLTLVEQEIRRPNGMLLVTGPTGSGKSTTLYAALRRINSPEIKIITIEDPIEYHLKGIEQTQVNDERGYTFLEGLRSALRQDPDVIMVGEIRDSETAKIAINSSLTGHLVFSTLHTNNAAGSFPRLIDLGVNPKVITSALSVALAQRLVRRLCGSCKIQATPSPEEWKLVQEVLASIPLEAGVTMPTTISLWKPRQDNQGTGRRPQGVDGNEPVDPNPTTPYALRPSSSPATCQTCGGIGYKGRIAIFEAIITDRAVEEAIQRNPSERDIVIAARPQGILDMRQDGILKALRGITSLEELQRVVDLHTESN
ncbi:MAG: hypothetical protein COV10_03965 [Candidatus Vogelbacteria bacterium CG10_big_fil_rev_8_21_14_0_10_51_16]|uniref:Bacterial type II secretion system protein E domain-containing protein n=1 Tax=Candidatus Vogelbacteria bacterium CG10_big_fil_rev_8_21_14_0_10_51_16 TaxID=1975045 RepID=A0A2H0RDL0_9BACT|nr:MAG: hypothetical protein COV10_03965 [Candidatus Vogelbacteria bacterium CG10_big_fil_rev_8_21_14_0_10_51_16]